MRGGLVALLCAGTAIAVGSCSFAPRSAKIANEDLTGVWSGSLNAACSPRQTADCLSRENITFTLIPLEPSLSGFYRCWTRDRGCADPGESGRVASVTIQPQVLVMRVMMRDTSSCVFEGVPGHEQMRGEYICLEARGAIAKGRWHVERAY